MSQTPTINLFHRATSIALPVPADWTVTASADFPLDLYAPAVGGYRASFGLARGPIASAERSVFAALIAERRAALTADLAGFTVLTEEQCWIDRLPAQLLTFDWQAEQPAAAFTQLFAVLLAGPQTVIEVHAVSLRRYAARYLPLFDAMLRSIRVVGSVV